MELVQSAMISRWRKQVLSQVVMPLEMVLFLQCADKLLTFECKDWYLLQHNLKIFSHSLFSHLL